MLPRLLQELTGSWRPHLENQGVILRPPLTAIQLGSGAGATRKINFLVFGHGEQEPSIVLKVSRDWSQHLSLKHEHQALCKFWDETSFPNGVPRPIGLFELNDTQVLIESYLPGTSMAVLLQRRLRTRATVAREDLNQARLWLSQLQKATYDSREPFPARMVIELSLPQLSDSLIPKTFANNLLAMAKEWEWLEVPWVGQHGDYWPGNLLIGDGCSVGVIDWEGYKAHALPFYDLFSFVTTYALALPWQHGRRLSRRDRFARVFLEDNWLASELLSCVNQHLDTWSLPRDCIRFFYALFLLEMALPALDTSKFNHRKASQWLDILRYYAGNERHSIMVKPC